MVRAPASCSEEKEAVKKGAWTAEEDEKLVSFIQKNKGHGSWRTLPKLAGLERCGKSCRLRWTNYLRPNIKRGNFSAEEERIILQLHAQVGNKWSSMASHLPGRTDNEVKNHWNTHLKKKLTKMGIDPVTHLPLNFFLHHHHHHNYGNLSSNELNQLRNSDWQKALTLQQSLQLINPSIACHLVQWELARQQQQLIEAEARQKLASPHHDTYIQSYYYAAWIQSLQQNQAPITFTLNDCIHAANLQSQQQAIFNNFYPTSLCEGINISPNLVNYTSCTSTFNNKDCRTLNNIEEIEHNRDDYAHTSTTNSIATPDTCSTNDSCNKLSHIDPHESSPSLNYHTSHHDSYWNRILNLVDHATFDDF